MLSEVFRSLACCLPPAQASNSSTSSGILLQLLVSFPLVWLWEQSRDAELPTHMLTEAFSPPSDNTGVAHV